MMIHGITPGPEVMTLRPDLFWGLIVSMWVGNLLLLVLNLPLIGIWVKLLRVPYRFLSPTISDVLRDRCLRLSLLISQRDLSVFLRPISGTLLLLTVGSLVMMALPALRARREVVFQEDDA